MHKIKLVLGRIIPIIIISAIIDVIFHTLLAPTYNYDYPPSYFVRNGLFQPAAGIALLIIYFLLCVVFIFIQEKLPGKKLFKGLRFGISFGVLWLIGFIGNNVFFGSPLWYELLGGACDCAALIILGILLGLFTATNNSYSSEKSLKRMTLAIILISFFFVLGQYLALSLIKGTPYFRISGLTTFIWTVLLGLWIGIIYWLLRQGIKGNSPIIRTFFFGGVIIGMDWILFNLFVLLIVDMPILDPIILAVFNIVSVIVGTFVFEILFVSKKVE